MRTTNLLKIAAEAETLRLRTALARQGRRGAFAALAAVFALGVLVLAECAGWLALRLYVTALPATFILLGINLVVAGIFGALAVYSRPSHAEQEAYRVRQQALTAVQGSFVLRSVVPVIRTLLQLRGNADRRSQPHLLR